MPFLTQGKTNWKFISIVIVLATIAGGGVLFWQNTLLKETAKLDEFTEIIKSEKVENETAGRETYRNEEYGFSFRYSKEDYNGPVSIFVNKNLSAANEDGLSVYTYDDTANFNWFLSDGAYSHALSYDKTKQQWQVEPGLNAEVSDAFCPIEYKTDVQKLSYYQIGDFRTGRSMYFAYVTKRGIFVLEETHLLNVDSIIYFDNPQDMLKVSCNIDNLAEKAVSDVAAAMENRDWAALYKLRVSSTFDLTAEQFAKDMEYQEALVGRVVSVEILSKPEQSIKDGVQIFTVLVMVTHNKDGVLTTDQSRDYYILQAGDWKFWYSAPLP